VLKKSPRFAAEIQGKRVKKKESFSFHAANRGDFFNTHGMYQQLTSTHRLPLSKYSLLTGNKRTVAGVNRQKRPRMEKRMRIRFSSRLFIVVCVTVMATFAQAQAAASDSESKDQIVQLERDWLKADGSGDTARLQQIIADDFVGTSFNGRLLNKEDIIPQGTGRPGGFAGATPGDSNVVRVFGDTGILMGIINTAKPEGQQIRVTLVCQRQTHGWRIIAAQLTGI